MPKRISVSAGNKKNTGYSKTGRYQQVDLPGGYPVEVFGPPMIVRLPDSRHPRFPNPFSKYN
jgi:hypothetical protein